MTSKSPKTTKENLSFQTEVHQILHLMIHALYSNKEIFLRELVSNAADACDKLRFEAVANDGLYEGDGDLRIEVAFDEKAKSITIRDNGVGMSRQEVIDNLGTIARSGTKNFLQNLTGDQKKDAHLIGQFGVGFYSSFIVAKKVEVNTRRAGLPANEGVHWEAIIGDPTKPTPAKDDVDSESYTELENESPSGYVIESRTIERRGTEVILHLKDNEGDFANHYRLRSIITQYSDHIPWPVKMVKQEYTPPKEDGSEEEKKDKPIEWETVNKANALWQQPKGELKDEDYKAFYKHSAHDWEDPLAWVHNKVEGKLEYTSLLYIPSKAPMDLWEPKAKHGIKIYVRRVFIMDDSEHILPRYLRFVRGVVDSNDLPLNVSREMLQGSRVIEHIKNASVKRILALMDDLAKNKPDDYASLWKNFGRVLKEGMIEEPEQKEALSHLLRFSTTFDDKVEQKISLKDYIARMKEGQEMIYYITAENHNAAKNSPHLEIFRKQGLEVILLSDRVDEWLVRQFTEYEGKKLQSVADGALDLSKLPGAADKKEIERVDAQHKDLVDRIKTALTDRVSEVKVSHRLTNSPACIVLGSNDMARYMKEWLQQVGQAAPDTKPILEINPEHPLLTRMNLEVNQERFNEWASVVMDQAILAEGGQLEDPAGFVGRLNKLIFNH